MLDVAATIDALVEHPSQTAILADYDGSLAPIVDRPEDAVALPATVEVLGRLVGRVRRVAIVSGRPVEYLVQHLPVPGVVLSGLYGMEHVHHGVRSVDPRVEPYVAAVAAAAGEAERRLPDVIVERKAGVSVTLHWRTAPHRADDVRVVAAALARQHGLHELPSRYAVELRPPIPVDKGTAVDTLVAGCAVAAFAGDDTGDLPAFAALARARDCGRLACAVRIGVRSPEMPDDLPGAVDCLVDGPAGLLTLLDAVATRLER